MVRPAPVTAQRRTARRRTSARADSGRADRPRATGGGAGPRLPAPAGLRGDRRPGSGDAGLAPVTDAVGYLVHRADDADGPFTPVDHCGNDVLAVPHPPYVDTSGERGREHWYAVAALPEVSTGPGLLRTGRRGRARSVGDRDGHRPGGRGPASRVGCTGRGGR